MAKPVKRLRSQVCAFEERHPTASKTDIARHFVDAGYARSGIYNILALLDNNQVDDLQRQELQRMLKKKTEGKVATSLGALGREVGSTDQTVKKYLSNMNIHVRKRKSRALVSELQIMNKTVNSIFPANREVAVLMDDETYLTLDGKDWQSTSYFTSLTKEGSSEVKFISHTKFSQDAVADNQREGDVKAEMPAGFM